MIGPLQNAMRLQAQRAMADYICSRIGIVTSYDPDNFSVRVNIQPEQIISGWLPVASPWIGDGWGMFAAPNVGDMLVVEFIDGRIDAGMVIARFYNDEDRPLAVQSGEFWLVHKLGGFFKLLNTGAVAFSDGSGATLTLNGDGTISSQATQWTHRGPVTFLDDVQVDGTVTANSDVIGGGKSLKTHLHGGVASGGSNTGPPV